MSVCVLGGIDVTYDSLGNSRGYQLGVEQTQATYKAVQSICNFHRGNLKWVAMRVCAFALCLLWRPSWPIIPWY